MIFARQIKFIDSLERMIFAQFESALRTRGFELEEAITEDQLFNRGVDGNENRLLGYSRTTIRIKIAKGQPVNRTTLRDENNFHPSITLTAFDNRFEISSNVTQAKFLIGRYGKDILKPTKDNMLRFVEDNMIPNLKSLVNEQLRE